MIKKKSKKSKAEGKKVGKKKRAAKGKKVEKTAAEVRKDLARLVKAHAKKMTSAVIGQGESGQLAPMRYLLEMAHVFPEVHDGSEATEAEDCLAKTLLKRLNIPETPVIADQDDEDFVTIPPRAVEAPNEAEPEAARAAKLEEQEVTVG